MNGIAAERPSFFEGQYLGANDLEAIVDYVRTQVARQNLGQHTWGIAIGLELVHQEIGPALVEYYVQPGIAVDGFGRIIVVSSPARIETDLFVGIGSGEVDVWIRYDQRERQGVRKGFEVCSAEDNYARISESFAIEVGNKSGILDRQSGVIVNDSTVNDAREALLVVNPNAPLVCDGSIPHQALPIVDEDSYWLVPLGHVMWSAAGNSFLPLVDPAATGTSDEIYESLMRSRTKRRLLGTVAETILAANGVIRLRDRFTPFDPAQTTEQLCAGFKVDSRDFKVCENNLLAKELIWLEGDTRIIGDARLFNGRLEFRDSEGRDYLERTVAGITFSPITPLFMQRADGNAKGGSDLQVVLGESDDGRNRLTIGQGVVSGTDLCDLSIGYSSQVIFQDNGRVGIGTVDPETILGAPLTIRGLEESITENEGTDDENTFNVLRLASFEGQGGDLEWQLDLWSDLESLSFNESGSGAGRLYLQAGGDIGISTTEPEAKLDITQVRASSGGSNLGDDLWFRVGNGGDDGRVWIEYGEQAAPLLVLSDHDNPPRIQFQQTNSEDPADDFSPIHSSWIGHAEGQSPDLAIMGGRVGVGTDNPDAQLTVQGNAGGLRLYSGRNSGHFWVGFYTDGVPGSTRAGWLGYGSDGTSDFTISNEKANGDIILNPTRNVGIDTNSPTGKLDVRGDIKFGPSGDLFAVGSRENLRVVVGRVNSGGGRVQGDGYSINKGTAGRYTIVFAPAFNDDPVVIATMYNETEHIVSVSNVTSNSCLVTSRDMLGTNAGDLQNAAFTFIAIGER